MAWNDLYSYYLQASQESVLQSLNDVNNTIQLLEQRLSDAKKNKEKSVKLLEKQLSIDSAAEEKILCNLINLRIYHSRKIQKMKEKIERLEAELKEKIQLYDNAIYSRNVAIDVSTKKLMDLENKEMDLLTQILKESNEPIPFLDDSIPGANDPSKLELNSNSEPSADEIHEEALLEKQLNILTKTRENLTQQVTKLLNETHIKIDKVDFVFQQMFPNETSNFLQRSHPK